jgi:hypothetical protein
MDYFERDQLIIVRRAARDEKEGGISAVNNLGVW